MNMKPFLTLYDMSFRTNYAELVLWGASAIAKPDDNWREKNHRYDLCMWRTNMDGERLVLPELRTLNFNGGIEDSRDENGKFWPVDAS